MTEDPTARTLRLLALLSSRPAWTPADLAARLGSSVRTVRRDVERLRRLGYAVAARPGPGSSYRLEPGVAVPPLLLEPDEVTAVVTALRLLAGPGAGDAPGDPAAASALVKLEQVLPRPLRARAEATDRSLEVLDAPTGPVGVTAAGIGRLAEAAAAGGWVRFDYEDRHARASQRWVAPYRQLRHRGRWYLVGYDRDREDWRLFRLDRVVAVRRDRSTRERPAFPAPSLAEWLVSDFGRQHPPAPGVSTA